MDSIILPIWTALHLPSHIKFRYTDRVAIENLLFEKLLVCSPLLSSSEYIGGVKGKGNCTTVRCKCFKAKAVCHCIAMAEIVVRSA